MERQAIDAGTRQTVPVRVASIWLALLVALLSSLLPGGLPSSTSFGSAFNPSTTVVALQPSRATTHMLVEQVRRDDDPAPGEPAAIFLSQASVQPVVRPAVAVDAPKPAAAPRPIAPHVGLGGTPRGPPLT